MIYNYLPEYVFLWIISTVASFVLLTLSICLFAGKDIAQKHCCSNPKIPFLANKYLLKVSVSNTKTKYETC